MPVYSYDFPAQLGDVINDVLSLLGEDSNSTAGDLRSGTGASSTISTAQTITQYVNESCAELARGAYPVNDYGIFTLPSGSASFSFTALTTTTGNVIWAPRGVAWNGIALDRCSRTAAELWSPSWTTDANATPAYWYPQGTDGVGLSPKPSSSSTVTVYGVAIPKLLANTTDPLNWLQPDLVKLIEFRTAARLAMRNAEDPSLGPRAELWNAEWEAGKQALLSRLWAEDPYFAELHYPRAMDNG